MEKISVVVITYNEESRLEQCLKSVAWADEIVVVDSGSTDRTLEIARKYTSKILFHPWQGYGLQKQFACSLAANEWILNLDADEYLSLELQHDIRVFQPNGEVAAVSFPRHGNFLGRWIANYHRADDRVVRLFHQNRAQFSDSVVHEGVLVQKGSVIAFESVLMHDGFRSLSEHVDRFNKYSSLEAQVIYDQGIRFRFWNLIYYPARRFVWIFIIKHSFTEGVPGIGVTFYWVWFEGLKYLKLYELGIHEMGSMQPFPESGLH